MEEGRDGGIISDGSSNFSFFNEVQLNYKHLCSEAMIPSAVCSEESGS